MSAIPSPRPLDARLTRRLRAPVIAACAAAMLSACANGQGPSSNQAAGAGVGSSEGPARA